MNKYNYFTLAMCGLTGVMAFGVQMMQTNTRGKTFGKNMALIEERYGETHRKEIGETT